MKRVQLNRNLFLDEYIPEELYKQYIGREHILVGLLDLRLIRADQMLRSKFGQITINNWINDGDRNWSGLRTPDSPYYSPTSQHTFGRASDKLFKDATAIEVRKFISDNWFELGITCIEANVNWVHSDVRWLQTNKLLIVTP